MDAPGVGRESCYELLICFSWLIRCLFDFYSSVRRYTVDYIEKFFSLYEVLLYCYIFGVFGLFVLILCDVAFNGWPSLGIIHGS